MVENAAPDPNLRNSFDRILDAAEILFSENGYKACTFRQISVAADVNQGMLHYYFTTKENLFRTTFMRRAGPLSETRMARLRQVTDAAGGTPALEAIIRSYIEPVLDMFKLDIGHRAFLRIHAQLRVDPLEFAPAGLRQLHFGLHDRRAAGMSAPVPSRGRLALPSTDWRIACHRLGRRAK